ncbi:amidohydrolase family protein [Novosphingobium sp.]|uniref:amidohydrolase family protein n=1 Tax=Novosphingobium sp. TaxID=1874826 RepID=UPI00286B1948|nr:amidohydrolase family protein [Novosphingobium sp.]
MRIAIASLAALLMASSAITQTPSAQLDKPPAGARHFVIQSTAGKHGDSWSWTLPDGTRKARESFNLRGQVWDVDYTGKPGRDGMPAKVTVRGVTPQGDAAESFSLTGGIANWQSPVDKGEARDAKGKFYLTLGGPMDTSGWALERLLTAPGRKMALLPGGEARAERLVTVVVGKGKTAKPVTLWQILGLSNTPVTMWADAKGKFFGSTGFLSWLPDAYAGEGARLDQIQTAELAKAAPRLYKQLVQKPTTPVAFTNVKLYDADNKRFLTGQTVVVSGKIIAAVGPAGSTPVPAGARVFDGTGKTLLPGLWDSHMHIADDYTGPQELSLGVTSVRDPGNRDSRTLDRRKRVEAEQLLLPHVYASMLIDGKGPFTAQMASVATTQDEAIAHVRRAKALGFTGVKFYGTFDYHWLPAAIAEAHRLGLHVHGHIPNSIRPSVAVADGYDEITHINWIVMEGVPAEVLPLDNGIARFEAPGRYAKDMDFKSPEMTALISTMAAKGVYSDPTIVTFEGLYVPENGDLSAAYAPFIGTLPVATERFMRSGGFAVPAGLTRADYRASFARMIALIGLMHKAGVPIVAGTDGYGIELIRELELYLQAGMTPGEALATATINPARLNKVDGKTGSIVVGKVADLVLVEGDPEARMGDLRQTRWVMMDGKLMNADDLRSAAGYSGRPL